MSSDKQQDISKGPITSPVDLAQPNERARDDALDFLTQHKNEFNAQLGKDAVYMNSVRRKIDICIISVCLNRLAIEICTECIGVALFLLRHEFP